MNSPAFDFKSMAEHQVSQMLTKHSIALTPAEAYQIQELLKRPPTLAECVLWGIQGSEHCSYKSSRAYLKNLKTSGPHVVLGAKEDAGVVRIATDQNKKNYCLVISHESHNHPSQIVPFEGAATGIGGNVRDISCMGATVVANADSLRFGDPKSNQTKWIKKGVVNGIASYSNSIGVPNIAGDVAYHPQYHDNCLVTVVSLGLVEEQAITHSYAPSHANGHALILVGKPTDNSGFGGASFASANLNPADNEANRGAVQEPNAFLGRVLLQANTSLFQQLKQDNLINQVGFKDLGAGGIACASVELADAANMGATVNLEKVPTSLPDLNPTIILCAETQERYMWVCPPKIAPLILEHYNKVFDLPNVSPGACAAVIGHIQSLPEYEVYFNDDLLIKAPAKDITAGIVVNRPIKEPIKKSPNITTHQYSLETLWQLMQNNPNLQSEDSIYQHYDKQVQGRVILERGCGDAGVIQPFNSQEYPKEIHPIGIALAVAANPRLSTLNPNYGAQHAAISAMYSVTAVGAEPWAMTDCLCFGNPEIPEQMWEFVESVQGLKIACESINLNSYPKHPIPIVAGNVSFYNQAQEGSIPASPIISCTGRLKNINYLTNWSLKKSGNLLYCLKTPTIGMGGSIYTEYQFTKHTSLPHIDLNQCNQQIHSLLYCIKQSWISSAKVINAGGIAFALQQMGKLKSLGANLTINNHEELFSEALGFILEVNPKFKHLIEEYLTQQNNHYQLIGEVINKPCLQLPQQTLYFYGIEND